MTSRAELRDWLLEAVRQHATHMIVVCDKFSYEDYPVFIYTDVPAEDFWTVYDLYNGKNMQCIMEVYDLSMDIEEQLKLSPVYNVPPARDKGFTGHR